MAQTKEAKKSDVLVKMSKLKNFSKKLKKGVDNGVGIWYSIKAPRERGRKKLG